MKERTLPQQIEYWAQFGQEVEPFLKRSDLLVLLQGPGAIPDVRIISKEWRSGEMSAVKPGIEKKNAERSSTESSAR